MDNDIVKEAKFIERPDGAYDLQVTMDNDAYIKLCEILTPMKLTIEDVLVLFLKSIVDGSYSLSNDLVNPQNREEGKHNDICDV